MPGFVQMAHRGGQPMPSASQVPVPDEDSAGFAPAGGAEAIRGEADALQLADAPGELVPLLPGFRVPHANDRLVAHRRDEPAVRREGAVLYALLPKFELRHLPARRGVGDKEEVADQRPDHDVAG